ncbi:VRR-NUC domain-containing protein [Marinobacter sp.]|uniref:VRR-NUC domain-containing protein n=1 Tax=Marinobacter sp. TaxID=50741 RepID=UPI00384C3CD6
MYGYHADLLLTDEVERIRAFQQLPWPSQALLARLVMRTGDVFRTGKLQYSELECPMDQATGPLLRGGWLDSNPLLTLDTLFRLLSRAECLEAFGARLENRGVSHKATKKVLYEALADRYQQADTLANWWPEAPDRVVELTCSGFFRRLRLMFFGNLRQDWSEFVLAELGYQNYETVLFSPQSRAFQHRSEVDIYLHLQDCRDRLESGEAAASVWPEIPCAVTDNPWLESRRGRLLFELGRLAERAGNPDLALQAWRESRHREARLRQLRLMERRGEYEQAWALATEAVEDPRTGAESRGLARLLHRLGKKVGAPSGTSSRPPQIPRLDLCLAKPAASSVEWAVLEHLSEPGAPVFYVENMLVNGLFALLCWPALYAPLPGAFFHPFHAAPADLHREDFVSRRSELFEDCLASLDSGLYRERILATWAEKQGTASPFLHWSLLTREVIGMALDCIPAKHLRACFERMLDDLKTHRSGLPDLVQFRPGRREYRLIEVKGPGDRLQDHQRQWLEFGMEQGIDLAVCYVTWQDEP